MEPNKAMIAAPPGPLSDSQRQALLRLLADEDAAVHQAVREKLVSYGHEALEWLNPCLLSNDPVLRRRARSIIHQLTQQDADNEFLAFCLRQGDVFSLEDGVWLLAKTTYPAINVLGYQAILDGFARDLGPRMAAGGNASQWMGALADFLFREQGFAGNETNYYEADNSYLNRVIDRRTGNPISLCAIFILVSRRLQLPVTGIGLPGHFICRYQSATEEIYVDPFNRGRLLSKADCVKYLHANNYGLHEEFLCPVSPRRMLLRMCSNLHQIYQQEKRAAETLRLQRYLVALAR